MVKASTGLYDAHRILPHRKPKEIKTRKRKQNDQDNEAPPEEPEVLAPVKQTEATTATNRQPPSKQVVLVCEAIF